MVGRFSRSNSKDYSQFAKIYNNTESYIPHKCSPRANLIVYSNWNAISCKSLLQPTASLYGEIVLMGTFHLWQTLWFSWKRAKRSFLLASAYNMYICTIYVQREREREREKRNELERVPHQKTVLLWISGFYSWRNPENGSWFIQALCQELNKNWKTHDLLRMMTAVVRRVSIEYQSFKPEKESFHQKKQVPSLVSMLTRLLFFGDVPLEYQVKNKSGK